MTPDRHGEIAKRAYTLWEVEGRPSGKELDHWLRAEAEVQAECAKTAPIRAERAEITAAAPLSPQRPAPRRTRRTQ